MKVKELNALLNKLAKTNPEADITLSYPGFLAEPMWDQPALVQTKQQAYIVPKSVEAQIEENHSPEEVANMIQQSYDQFRQQGRTGATAA